MAQTNDHKSNDLFIILANVGLIAAVAAMSIVSLLRVVDHFRPRIGDIIAFNPAKVVSSDAEPRIEVTPAGAPPAVSCILDVRTMRKSNGSLIIEATRPDRVFDYRVHWSGGPSSEARNSCGTSADLLLSEAEVSSLKMAANP